MDILAKVIVVIIFLIIVFVIYYNFFGSANLAKKIVTRSEAVNMVVADILNSTPNANISHIITNSSPIENGSWQIFTTVAYNTTKPCPTLLGEMFDYPATGLNVTTTTYVQKCKVYSYSNEPYYLVSMPEVAITISYNLSKSAQNYVNTYGYGNVNVYAKFYPNLTANILRRTLIGNIINIANSTVTNQSSAFNTLVNNSILSNIWLINYSAKNSPYFLYIEMYQSGNIINQFLVKPT
ncbi:MAG: hypothetical protein M1538_02465 [Candidatus Marsarchaeota archaeon]|jgi:hypothetical protein|nr:hypothetical protein [Candidatus Marsarchaeota archaeon]